MKIVLLVLLVSVSAFAKASIDDVPQEISSAYSTLTTFKEMTNQLRREGVAEDQVVAIETFLKTQGLALETKMPAMKTAKHEVAFGASKLVWNDKLEIKTTEGLLLKYDASADKLFEQTFHTLMGRDVGSIWMSRAYAAPARAADAAAASSWTLSIYGSYAKQTVVAGLYDAWGYLSTAADHLKNALANTTHGHLRCDANGDYVMTWTYQNFDNASLYRAYQDAAGTQANNAPTWLRNDARSRVAAWDKLFTLTPNKDVIVSRSFLQKYYTPSGIQRCNAEYNGKDIEACVKSPGATDDDKIRYCKSKEYGPSPRMDYDNHGQPHPMKATH